MDNDVAENMIDTLGDIAEVLRHIEQELSGMRRE